MPPYKTDKYKPSTGHRGELYSRKLRNTAGISFFFNLKENREGDIYLNIVESKQHEEQNKEPYMGQSEIKQNSLAPQASGQPKFERHSILIFPEQREAFTRECLAALAALNEKQDFQSHIETSQRDFHLQINKKRGFLMLREQSQHYDKPLQEQIQIPQSSASYFSKALIETVEQWLLLEKAAHKKRPTKKKKIVTVQKRATE